MNLVAAKLQCQCTIFGIIMNKNDYQSVPLEYTELPVEQMIENSKVFFELMSRRRTVRAFSDRSVPQEIIANAIKTAGSAPSGANMQPWHFVAISNKDIKHKIRLAAEEEEREFYASRAPEDWLDALAPLGTDDQKPFLEHAPWLIVVFQQKYSFDAEGTKQKHYYPAESVGIASGLLISALHNAGLATLTHTPSPMQFLTDICQRPAYEKPIMILVAGYPEKDVEVPAINRYSIDHISSWL